MTVLTIRTSLIIAAENLPGGEGLVHSPMIIHVHDM